MTTNRAYQMTALHSALVFIEESLPTYYDAKDKTNPLKDHQFTPNFHMSSFGAGGGLIQVLDSNNVLDKSHQSIGLEISNLKKSFSKS